MLLKQLVKSKNLLLLQKLNLLLFCFFLALERQNFYTTVGDFNRDDREEVFSRRVKAGKRTYFFDVKATRSDDYYITITESKKRYNGDNFTYEKHKIFLYKEDFNKFAEALNEAVDHVKEELLPDYDYDEKNQPNNIDDELSWS